MGIKNNFAALLIAISAIASAPSYAQFFNGQDIVKGARDTIKSHRGETLDSYYSSDHFSGFVVGVFDIAKNEDLICIDGQVSVGQVSILSANWILDHPADWNKPGFIMVIEALQNAFPCT